MFERPLSMRLEGDVLALEGSVGENTIVTLREELTTLVAARAFGAIDLSDVDFLPSSALGVLVRARAVARAQGEDVVFVATPGSVAHRILSVTGLPHLRARPGSSDGGSGVSGVSEERPGAPTAPA